MARTDTGRVTMDIDGHVCTITVDNTSKKNAYTPAWSIPSAWSGAAPSR